MVYFGTRTSTDLGFMTNNTSRLYLASTGNIGIGTTSPQTTLDVNGVVTAANINQAPIISSGGGSTFTTVSNSTWQYTGVSVSFTVPPGPNRKYRISSRVLGTAAAGEMYTYVSNSSSSAAGLPVGM